jgi:hypothetical protein
VNTLPTVRDLFNDMVSVSALYKKSATLTVAEFTRILRKFVGTANIRVISARDATVDINQVIINGSYDPLADQFGEPSITMVVNYNPEQKTVRFKDVDWKQICIDLLECTGHEIVHQRQYRSRDFEVSPTLLVSKNSKGSNTDLREYLGQPDEVEANGYSIATEVYLKWAPPALNSKTVSLNPIFKAYCAAFGTNHIIVRKLVNYSSKYFEYLNKEPTQ